MAKKLESVSAPKCIRFRNVHAVVLFLVEASTRKVERSALGALVFFGTLLKRQP